MGFDREKATARARAGEKPLEAVAGALDLRRRPTIERLLSVDQTCRLQRRSLYAYLAGALTAKARGDPVPSL